MGVFLVGFMEARSETNHHPLLLAVETSTEVSSVALFQGTQLMAVSEYREARGHAQTLMPSIDAMFTQFGLSRNQLQGVILSCGPGSYTGLRVGTATAKGLCLALGIPLFPVDTLEGLAFGMRARARKNEALIVPLMDARRMEVYYSVYSNEIDKITGPEALILREDAFSALLDNRKVVFAGDGLPKATSLLERHPHAILLPEVGFSAVHLIEPGLKKFLANERVDLLTFEPFYMKEFNVTIAKDRLA